MATRTRLQRPERRESILRAAARAFVRAGYAATSMDDVATEAGVTKMILYQHFSSKHELYDAVLDRIERRLLEASGRVGERREETLSSLLQVAREDPDGFLLYHRQWPGEPRYERYAALRTEAAANAETDLRPWIEDPVMRRWAAEVAPDVLTAILTAWLRVGTPDRDQDLLERLKRLLAGLVDGAAGHGS